MNFKAAIFDMDGTLVDSLMVWDVLWSDLGEKYFNNKNFRPVEADDKKVRTLTLSDAMELIHKNYDMGNSGEELLNVANNLLIDFYKHKVQLKKGVREFLEHLLKNNIKMCVATATASTLVEIAMKKCGLEKYFSKVFSCATVGKGKEEPDIFLLACEFLGEGIEQTVVFEDSLVAIKTATKIGMQTVGIFDRYNFGKEEIEKIATEYIKEDETLLKIIK